MGDSKWGRREGSDEKELKAAVWVSAELKDELHIMAIHERAKTGKIVTIGMLIERFIRPALEAREGNPKA